MIREELLAIRAVRDAPHRDQRIASPINRETLFAAPQEINRAPPLSPHQAASNRSRQSEYQLAASRRAAARPRATTKGRRYVQGRGRRIRIRTETAAVLLQHRPPVLAARVSSLPAGVSGSRGKPFQPAALE